MTPASPLQIVSLAFALLVSVVSLAGALFAIGRVILVTEVRVSTLTEAMREVRAKADGTDKDVTGPVSIRAATMARDIAHVAADVDVVRQMLTAFISEYRDDQKGKHS